MKIAIINGPNLNLVGVREPEIYGGTSLDAYLETLKKRFSNVEFSCYQSNVEGELVNEIQRVGFNVDGIILNAGAYTHTSIAMGDAIRAVKSPCIEVHISNVEAREDYRRVSMIGPACKGLIAGFGLDSYRLAVEAIIGDKK
jgi:3-dehydroquinate dehydratase II